MTDDELALAAMEGALDALHVAAAELTVAISRAPRSFALANDACLLVQVLEANLAAVLEAMRRQC